jgi:hypothetical protein
VNAGLFIYLCIAIERKAVYIMKYYIKMAGIMLNATGLIMQRQQNILTKEYKYNTISKFNLSSKHFICTYNLRSHHVNVL